MIDNVCKFVKPGDNTLRLADQRVDEEAMLMIFIPKRAAVNSLELNFSGEDFTSAAFVIKIINCELVQVEALQTCFKSCDQLTVIAARGWHCAFPVLAVQNPVMAW